MDSIVPQQPHHQPQWQQPQPDLEPIQEIPPYVPPYVAPEPAVVEIDEQIDEPVFEPEAFPSSITEEVPEIFEAEEVVETPQVPEVPTEKVSYADSSIQELEIARIVANPYQPRTQFKPEALQELADSIKEHGVIQPIVVTETSNGYEIVVGERRFRASQLAGLTKVPAIVKKTLHDQTKLEVALIENIQRQELNAIEEARGYDRLIKSFNLTQDQVAKKVGKSRSAVANTLRLLNLPAEIQRGVIEGKVTEGHARAILGLGEMEKMILMYQTIQDQGLNVRQVEAKVREITVKRKMDAATPDPKLMAIETELRGKLHTQVKIQRQGRGGKITIDFFSDEDLEEIMNRIAEQQSGSDDNYLVV
ncbi:MAG TPA: ParB/RepB/Spo0J family partition protein [Patescibacteria group bacterium]|jgi:ParB family chromosome partitioning protein|nr:ParB/RepB/Spo0J family partition protein [Patescibacteria group bacterium]